MPAVALVQVLAQAAGLRAREAMHCIGIIVSIITPGLGLAVNRLKLADARYTLGLNLLGTARTSFVGL